MNCTICGRPVDGDGNICDGCLDEMRQPTTSFSPVTTATQSDDRGADRDADTRSYCLMVTKGPHVSERFYLDSDRMSIGRDPRTELFLNDRTVSREHAVIERSDASYALHDVGSLNGTYVNGEVVDDAELKEGDEIQIGTFHLLFTSCPEETSTQ